MSWSMATADDHRTYSIRQLCREFGATARALRFYEDKGLLTPARKGQTLRASLGDSRLDLIAVEPVEQLLLTLTTGSPVIPNS